MLLYFKFNNFYSFLDEAEVSFQLGKQATKSDYDFEIETTQDKLRLNKVMAVLGANGSGKTQSLKAFAFMTWFMLSSAKYLGGKEIPFSTFANEEGVSSFEWGFLLPNEDNIFEEYRYQLLLSKNKIHKESLYKKTSRQFSYIFVREYKNNELIYKHNGFLKKNVADDVAINCSLFSYSLLFDQELANRIFKQMKCYAGNVRGYGRVDNNVNQVFNIAKRFNDNEKLKGLAEKLLCEFDTGINRIEIRNIEVIDATQQAKEMLLPFTYHQYNNQEFELSIFDESSGTQSAFIMLGFILSVLDKGGFAIIDELDNDLHPHLLPVILDLFRSKHSNPHNAQLIFSCHTPEVFNILNKHQIYLVEKYQQQSEAWRLDEVEGVRNDDNLYAKYMARAFDAVPNL